MRTEPGMSQLQNGAGPAIFLMALMPDTEAMAADAAATVDTESVFCGTRARRIRCVKNGGAVRGERCAAQ